MLSRKKKGMLAAFIDFRKAYDRVDQSRLWDCPEGAGLKGRLVNFNSESSLLGVKVCGKNWGYG